MTVVLCQHCGADLSHHPALTHEGVSLARCFDCGLAPDDGGAWHRPFDRGEEIYYRLHDWSPAERVRLVVMLYDVPFRWQPGPVLVIREDAVAVVESFLDEARRGCDDRGDTAGLVDDDEAGDEVAAAMSELFVTADRLLHAPWDTALLARMAQLAALVEVSDPPFGIGAKVWAEIATRARAVAAAGDSGELDDVEGDARQLRLFLRDYV